MALIKHGNNALSNVTAFPSAVPTGKPTLISTATASSSSSIEFTSGIDSTYDVYQFEFINIHPATNRSDLDFNMSTDGGSNYNVTKTTTFFRSFNFENDNNRGLGYLTANDLAQSTGEQMLSNFITNENDSNASGSLYLFAPSSDTFVKHFISDINHGGEDNSGNNFSYESFVAGYGNTTSAINAVRFQMSSGNIDAGTIKMYGISA